MRKEDRSQQAHQPTSRCALFSFPAEQLWYILRLVRRVWLQKQSTTPQVAEGWFHDDFQNHL